MLDFYLFLRGKCSNFQFFGGKFTLFLKGKVILRVFPNLAIKNG